MIEVIMIESMAGPEVNWPAGSKQKLEDAKAIDLIAKGMAVEAKPIVTVSKKEKKRTVHTRKK